MSERARRWTATLAVAALASAVCVVAGLWQWSRYETRSAAIAVVEANDRGPAVPVDQVVDPTVGLDPQDVWRHVSVVGTYLPDSTVLLRNRPVSGNPAFHVLAGFQVTQGELAGSVLVVNRGWVPSRDGAGAASVPAPPPGPVEVVVRARADEPASSRSAPAGQVQAISTEQVRIASGAAWTADATLPFYGAVLTEDGERPAGLGALAPPSTTPGSHLSYAFQWWVFAVGALVGGVMLLRRDERDAADAAAEAAEAARADDPALDGVEPPARPAAAGRERRRRRPTAEEEEDALLDAQQDAHLDARQSR